MDRDRDRGRRFDDGEVVRYGAGESWRPTPRGGSGGGPPGERERSPPRRPPRSPLRDRDRLPPRSPRLRSPRPRSPGPSDSYVPGGRYPPRRRSISPGERFRRDRSRDISPPRRRERSRSPMRRSPLPPRRSLSRRGSPRMRSPRRDWDRDRDRDWDRDRDRMRDRDRDFDRRDDRRMSRSPFGARRDRSPGGRSPPRGPYRPRSRSPRDRYQHYRRPSPHRDSGISSAITSQPNSERASPRPPSLKGRSPLYSRDHSPRYMPGSGPGSVRDGPRDSLRSPPRGPAALRPPTGPSSHAPWGTPGPQISPQPRHQSIPGPLRSETASPTNPPSGPRGYMPPSRGGYSSRPRGGWAPPSSRPGLSPGPPTPTTIPTGPRGGMSTGPSTPTQGRPFNPPTGPAAQHGSGPRQTLAQSLLATMPPIIPGGKLDPAMLPMVIGVTREIEPHYRKLRDEEERLREDLYAKQERLRKNLAIYSRMERESAQWELRSDLSEKSVKNLAGEGIGGAAF